MKMKPPAFQGHAFTVKTFCDNPDAFHTISALKKAVHVDKSTPSLGSNNTVFWSYGIS